MINWIMNMYKVMDANTGKPIVDRTFITKRRADEVAALHTKKGAAAFVEKVKVKV